MIAKDCTRKAGAVLCALTILGATGSLESDFQGNGQGREGPSQSRSRRHGGPREGSPR